jgi:hypothetical protein
VSKVLSIGPQNAKKQRLDPIRLVALSRLLSPLPPGQGFALLPYSLNHSHGHSVLCKLNFVISYFIRNSSRIAVL